MCVCVHVWGGGSLCYLWRTERPLQFSKVVQNEKKGLHHSRTTIANHSRSVSLSHTCSSTAFLVFSIFLIYNCSNFEMLLTVNWQLHVRSQPKAHTIHKRYFTKKRRSLVSLNLLSIICGQRQSHRSCHEIWDGGRQVCLLRWHTLHKEIRQPI